jgi:hypothetical protein
MAKTIEHLTIETSPVLREMPKPLLHVVTCSELTPEAARNATLQPAPTYQDAFKVMNRKVCFKVKAAPSVFSPDYKPAGEREENKASFVIAEKEDLEMDISAPTLEQAGAIAKVGPCKDAFLYKRYAQELLEWLNEPGNEERFDAILQDEEKRNNLITLLASTPNDIRELTNN